MNDIYGLIQWKNPDAIDLWSDPTHFTVRDGPLTLVMDGAIYNQADEISAQGFPTDMTEAELALELFHSQGVSGLARLNADLALAVYDRDCRELTLFRDRFGVRPLYYAELPDGIVFASTIRAILAHPDVDIRPNMAMLFDFLSTHYRYIHQDPAGTYYQGVFRVQPAHVVTVNSNGRTTRAYWELNLDPDVGALSPVDTQHQLFDLFRDSVGRRLETDEAIGFSVSSGMDSSSVASMAANLLGEPQRLYSISYGYGEYDETAGIRELADRYGRTWQNIVLARPSLFDRISCLVRDHDGPLCTVTWLSHAALADVAADDCRILFSGLGGDECLSGEYEHFFYYFADLKLAGQTRRLDEEINGWIALHDHPVFKKTRRVVDDVFTRLVDFQHPGRIRLDERRYRAYLHYFQEDFIDQHQRAPHMICPFDSYLVNRCWQDLFYETTPPSLTADEKNVRRRGMTTRFPFLDHRLLTFCYSLPGYLKYDRGVTKAVMRRAMTGILPESNRTNTTKTGFNAPLNDWLIIHEQERLNDLLTSRSLRERGWLKPGAANRLLEEHRQGNANHMMFFWQIINAELWLKSLGELS
jgi:asparagine synthase (glutamine-hydrolysing)